MENLKQDRTEKELTSLELVQAIHRLVESEYFLKDKVMKLEEQVKELVDQLEREDSERYYEMEANFVDLYEQDKAELEAEKKEWVDEISDLKTEVDNLEGWKRYLNETIADLKKDKKRDDEIISKLERHKQDAFKIYWTKIIDRELDIHRNKALKLEAELKKYLPVEE
jgi:prefoldin subunit 5